MGGATGSAMYLYEDDNRSDYNLGLQDDTEWTTVDYCLLRTHLQGYFQGNPGELNLWGCIVLVESSRRQRSPRSMVATTLVAKLSGNDESQKW